MQQQLQKRDFPQAYTKAGKGYLFLCASCFFDNYQLPLPICHFKRGSDYITGL